MFTSKEAFIKEVAGQLSCVDEIDEFGIDFTEQDTAWKNSSDFSIYGGYSEQDLLDTHDIIWMDTVGSRKVYEWMQDFAETRPEEIKGPLQRALDMVKPFAVFRYACEEHGVLEDWYQFKDAKYIQEVEEQFEELGIDFVDGKIVKVEPKSEEEDEA